MPLQPGSRLGPYEIVSPLGEGGMGEVYRARDSKLNRDVAIKVLLSAVADDTGRLARFSREAQVLASLNHPNIAHIYGFEERALVMELVEGPTLADRIAQGPIPLDDALPIARQIVDALEAAHEQGIVHRDLKPANVKVRPDGTVKILDFGLAKATDPAIRSGSASISPTLTSPAMMTAAGVILGTAAYMAPEQAKGRAADKRSDIWAFGAVFFEMLTGRRLFAGEDMMETLAAVVMKDFDLTAAPAAYRRLLRRCLDRDPKKRLQHIGDVWECVDADTSRVAPASRSTVLPWAIASACALVAAGVVTYTLLGTVAESASTMSANLTLNLTPAERLGGAGDFNRPSRTGFTITPDGQTVVFVGVRGDTRMLYQRALAAAEAQPIPGTEGAEYPFVSPDGRWVGFAAPNKLRKVALAGGPPIDLCDLTQRIAGASWSSSGTIVVADLGLWTVPEAGGMRTKVLDRKVTETFWSPLVLPNGQTILFTVRDGDTGWEHAHVDALNLVTKKRTTVLTNAVDARYLTSGHLVFMRNANLLATAFDSTSVAAGGAPVPLVANVAQAANAGNSVNETGMGQFALSATGVLLYAPGGIYDTPSTTLVRVSPQGRATRLVEVKGALYGVRLSPDETRVVATKMGDGSRVSDLWSFSLSNGLSTRLTTTGDAQWGLFGSGSRGITFSRFGEDGGAYLMPADAGVPQRILPPPGETQQTAASWSRDGKWLLYLQRSEGMAVIYARPMDPPGEPVQVLSSSFQIMDPDLSPNGRWVAYRSNESGADEIYVHSFAGAVEKHRISSAGGSNPVWSRDGRGLFYVTRGPDPNTPLTMMAVDIEDVPQFHAGSPHALFTGVYSISIPLRSYDVTSNGDFIMVGRNGDPPDRKISALTVVIGWGDVLKRRVPTSER